MVSTERLKVVDALRGLAASMVLFHHLFVRFNDTFEPLRHWAPLVHQLLQSISDLNLEAVLLFFVVSGFSIRFSSHRQDFRSSEEINLYIYKRFRRLLPLYWLALLLALVVGAIAGQLNDHRYGLATLAGNLFFLQSPVSVIGNWFGPYGYNDPLWSLSFEMFFYISFLVLAVCVRTSRFWGILAIVISVVGLAVNQIFANPIAQFASLFVVWFFGVELADSRLGLASRMSRTVLLGFGVLCALFLFFRESQTVYQWLYGFLVFAVWQAFVFGSEKSFPGMKLMANVFVRLFGYLGSISYALYLFHFPIVYLLFSFVGDNLQSLFLSVIFSIAVSHLAERTIGKYEMKVFRVRYVR
ncbi:MAG: acyltransferase [Pseudomonadales bacterium]|nr:acyltransferase [Pseudomonadales bacterium]